MKEMLNERLHWFTEAGGTEANSDMTPGHQLSMAAKDKKNYNIHFLDFKDEN